MGLGPHSLSNCFPRRASQRASDSQSPTPGLLAAKPAPLTGEGAKASHWRLKTSRWGSLAAVKAAHLGEGKPWCQTSAALRLYLITGKTSGVNLEDKSGVETLRRTTDAQQYLPAVPVVKLAPKLYWFIFSFGLSQWNREGDTDVWAAQCLHINPPRPSAQTGEDTSAVSQDSGTTRDETVYRF